MAKRRAHGEGSVVQLADGTWRAVVPIGGGRRKWVRGKTRAEVVRKASELKAKRDQGLPVTTGSATVGEYLDAWLADAAPSLRTGTYRSHESSVRIHLKPGIGRHRLDQLGPAHVQRLMNDLSAGGLSSSSVIRIHATLRRALTQAERWGLVARNVAKLVDLPSLKRPEIEPFTSDEAREFLALLKGHRMEALYSVAISLGLRQGEALGLRWSDVDLDNRVLNVRHQLQTKPRGGDIEWLTETRGLVPTKSHRSRRLLPIPVPLADQLRLHRANQSRDRLMAGDRWVEHDLVFPTRHGMPYDGVNITHRFQAFLAEHGLPRRRFHDLRHSCGSLLAAQGVPLHEVQAILGHAQLSTTMIYVHSVPEGMRRATDQMGDALWGTAAAG